MRATGHWQVGLPPTYVAIQYLNLATLEIEARSPRRTQRGGSGAEIWRHDVLTEPTFGAFMPLRIFFRHAEESARIRGGYAASWPSLRTRVITVTIAPVLRGPGHL